MYLVRRELARALNLPEDQVRVQHAEGAGCYGHNGADDAVVRIAADVDARGDVLSWQHEVWSNGHATRPGFARPFGFLAASHRDGGAPMEPAADPPLDRGGGAGRNAVPGYAFPAWRAVPRRLTIAVDAGLVVNPDGAENQIEGGAIQAASWTLKERVRFDQLTVTSDTWESYPILRFCEVPSVSASARCRSPRIRSSPRCRGEVLA